MHAALCSTFTMLGQGGLRSVPRTLQAVGQLGAVQWWGPSDSASYSACLLAWRQKKKVASRRRCKIANRLSHQIALCFPPLFFDDDGFATTTQPMIEEDELGCH